MVILEDSQVYSLIHFAKLDSLWWEHILFIVWPKFALFLCHYVKTDEKTTRLMVICVVQMCGAVMPVSNIGVGIHTVGSLVDKPTLLSIAGCHMLYHMKEARSKRKGLISSNWGSMSTSISGPWDFVVFTQLFPLVHRVVPSGGLRWVDCAGSVHFWGPWYLWKMVGEFEKRFLYS